MFTSLVIAAALTMQAPRTRPWTPQERAAYMKQEARGYGGGFTHFVPSPEMKARQRKFDAWNRSAKSVSQMRFTIWGAIQFAQKYPPGSPQLREYQRRLRAR